MMASAVEPRRDQVAELTRGIRLPRQAIENVHLQILAEGLHEAFDDLRQREPATVAFGDEAEVTALMEARLNRLIDENPFWRQLVVCVVRGKETVSFDGSHLEKRPDLSIFLSDRTLLFPLVVEAKILDAPNAKTVASYCERGLRRFVDGEYAWGNREAFMVGYVRDGSSIETTLKPCIARAMAVNPPGYLVQGYPVHVGSEGLDLAYTTHGRAFVYGNQAPPNCPGPISVWHLWLSLGRKDGADGEVGR